MKAKKTMVGNIDPDILAFTVGKDPVLDLALGEVDCIGTAAHVTMLSRMPASVRVISPAEKNKVVKQLVAIIALIRNGSFNITASDQDIHLAVEKHITGKLGDVGKKIHTARSRNDQVATDIRLYSKNALFTIMNSAGALALELIKFAARYEKVPMVGRTHMRPAMPSSVGLWASAHAESLLDDLTLLESAYNINDRCPLGSAAGYGVPLKINRNLTSRLLGFREPVHNSLYASNSRGKCESVILSALNQVMLTLSRLAEDLIIYSAPEFGYFVLPDAFCTGSSIMPQKKNPDVLELVRGKAARLTGLQVAACSVIKSMPGGYHRDLQETKELLMDGVQTTADSLSVLVKFIGKLKADEKALAKGFTPEVFAADWALELTAGGMSFRDAYNHVRENLSDLENKDPYAAVAAKRHTGAPAGLDLAMLSGRAEKAIESVEKNRTKYHKAISGLLGIRYSEK